MTFVRPVSSSPKGGTASSRVAPSNNCLVMGPCSHILEKTSTSLGPGFSLTTLFLAVAGTTLRCFLRSAFALQDRDGPLDIARHPEGLRRLVHARRDVCTEVVVLRPDDVRPRRTARQALILAARSTSSLLSLSWVNSSSSVRLRPKGGAYRSASRTPALLSSLSPNQTIAYPAAHIPHVIPLRRCPNVRIFPTATVRLSRRTP